MQITKEQKANSLLKLMRVVAMARDSHHIDTLLTDVDLEVLFEALRKVNSG